MSHKGRTDLLYCPLCEELEAIEKELGSCTSKENHLLEHQGAPTAILSLKKELPELLKEKERIEVQIIEKEERLRRLEAYPPYGDSEKQRLGAIQAEMKPLCASLRDLEPKHPRCHRCKILLGSGHEEQTIKRVGDKTYCYDCYKKEKKEVAS